jgi:hypothetical protein
MPPMPDAAERGGGREDHRHQPNPPVGKLLVGDVGVASGMHLSSDRQGSGTVAGTHDRPDRRDVGPHGDASLDRVLPRLHGEPGRSRRHGDLHAGGARPIGASGLLRIRRGLTTRPQATHQRLHGAAGPRGTWRVPTPNRSRPRFLHSPMPACGLARRLAPLTP